MTCRQHALADDAASAARAEPATPAEPLYRISHGENPVRIWRQHRGLTATELARRAGVSGGYLSAIETGRQEGSVRVLRALAGVLDTDVDDLLSMPD